jgi:hypothetical protein
MAGDARPLPPEPTVIALPPLPAANPFVALSGLARLLLVAYVVGWRMLPDLAAALQFADLAGAVPAATGLLAGTAANLLLLLPLCVTRFAGTPIGWLHPLVLPTLLVLAKDLLKRPESLLLPVLAWFAPPALGDYELLRGLPPGEQLAVVTRRDVLLVVAQLAWFAGFAVHARPPGVVRIEVGNTFAPVAFAVIVAAGFAVLALLVQANGGLAAHFAALALGRFEAREATGHLLVIVGALPYVVLLAGACRPAVVRRPWFVALVVAASAAQFVATGSRSNTLLPVAAYLALWIWANGRIPAGRIAVLALVPLFAVGLLGGLRASGLGLGDEAAEPVAASLDAASLLERAREEIAGRDAVSGEIAILQKVPDEVPHLHGLTYVSAVAFFVPRSRWPEKPRGVGAHVAAMLFEGWPSTLGYTGQSFPAGGMAEAYWNFGVGGVVVAFAAFGLFYRLLAQQFLARPRDPFVVVLLVMALVTLGDIDSDSVVGFLQRTVLLYLAWRGLRAGAAPPVMTPARGPA